MDAGMLTVMWGRRREADMLVKRYHYSRRIPSNVQSVITWHLPGGLLGDTGEAIAACYFTIPPTRWSEPVWELNRLVRWEGPCPQLTGLVGQACRLIRSKNAAGLLVSFADSAQGHHGGIYQAASWNYHGQRAVTMDGIVIEGQFIPGRNANARFGTRSPARLAAMGIEAQPHYDEGKHLYWRALTRGGEDQAFRLGLRKNPYPKPDNEISAKI